MKRNEFIKELERIENYIWPHWVDFRRDFFNGDSSLLLHSISMDSRFIYIVTKAGMCELDRSFFDMNNVLDWIDSLTDGDK